jgi:hypothetical protein
MTVAEIVARQTFTERTTVGIRAKYAGRSRRTDPAGFIGWSPLINRSLVSAS